MAKLKIYLFRHGESFFNRAKEFTGWKDSKLTAEGKRNAQKVAQKLKTKKIDLAVQTRLSRSKETMKEMLKYHPECRKVIVDDRMIERSYGKFQGKKHSTIIKQYGQKQFDLWHRSYTVAPPGGESIQMVEKRVKSFIKDLLRKMKKEKINVAVSAHGNSMRPFRRYFEHLTIKEMMQLENPWDDYFEYEVKV